MRLAFPINAHQNANQKPIGSAPSYRVQCTLPPQLMCQTLLSIFRGSDSETKKGGRGERKGEREGGREEVKEGERKGEREGGREERREGGEEGSE